MTSTLKVDVIDTTNPAVPVNILGASAPTYAGTVLMTVFPPKIDETTQSACKITAGTGAPSGGSDGWIYFRSDGGALTTIYQRRSGSWVGIV
jgi:hypothetical protein